MRILVIAAVLLTLLGGAFIGVGIAQGGSLRYLHVGKDTASWWPFSGTFGIGYDGAWEEEHYQSWKRSLPHNEDLSLDISIGDIVFQEGETQEIQFQNFNKEDVTIKQEHQTTKIKVKGEGAFLHNNHKKVIVTMPKKAFKKIEIDNKMGDITMDNLYVDKLEIEVKMGDIKVHHLVSKALQVENKAGDIEIFGNLTGRSEIENKMGDITVAVKGKAEDYFMHVQTKMGDTSINGSSYEGSSDIRQGKENSANQIRMEAKMGDVKLRFD